MLDPDNPFIINVPKGASHIDLGPILRPLIWAIRSEIIRHESRQHRGNRDSARLLDPKVLGEFLEENARGLRYRELLPRINRQMLIDYLMATEWVPEDDTKLGFIRDYDVKRSSWDRLGPRIWVPANDRDSDYARDETIRYISCYERISKLEAARRIIAQTNILDRLAAELD